MLRRRLAIRSLLIASVASVAAACGDGTVAPGQDSSVVATTTGVTIVTEPPTEPTPPTSSTQAPSTSASTPTTDTSVVEPSTSSPVTTPIPSDAPVVLRPDGLGPYAFMTPRRQVEPWLTLQLGPPERYAAQGPMLVTCGMVGCEDGDVLWWRDAGLLVAFSSRDILGEEFPEPLLTSWTVTLGPWWPGKVSEPTNVFDPALVPTRLATADGVGLGTTAADLDDTMPSTEFLAWNDGTFVPNGFYVPAGTDGVSLEGDLDWEVVTDLQRALNDAGADVAVDGVAGPRTRAALLDYRDRHGLQSWSEVLTALRITQPDPESRVVRLSAGWWWWEFDCGGELEVFGLADQC